MNRIIMIVSLLVFSFAVTGLAVEAADVNSDTTTYSTEGSTGTENVPAEQETVSTFTMSHDQGDQFAKTMSTKLDSFNKRIDMLDENAKKAPKDIGDTIKQKTAELYAQSDDVKRRIDALRSSARESWDGAKAEAREGIDQMERDLIEAEKSIQ